MNKDEVDARLYPHLANTTTHTIDAEVYPKLSEAMLNRWPHAIPVSERLPREHASILIWTDNYDQTWLRGCLIGNGDWVECTEFDSYVRKQDKVTHWLPLPPKPTE